MPSWNGVPIPGPPNIKIPSSIPQNFNWNSYKADPNGTFNKFKGAREVNRINWKGYLTTSAKTKKAILSSPSKKIINAAAQQVRSLRKAKKIAENTKKVQDAFFKKMPGGATPKNGGIAGGQLLGIVLQGGLALAVINNILIQNSINDAVDRQLLRIGLDGSKIFTSLGTLYSRVKNLDIKFDTKIQKFERELTANAKDYLQLNKQQEATSKNAVEVKQKVNDALYETRQGRTILEGKIAESKKQSNDALYEARTTKQNIEKQVIGVRVSLEAKIQQVNSQISKFNNSANEAFQKAISTTVSKVQADLALTKAQVNSIRQNPSINASEINANAIAAAKAIVAPLQSAVGALSNQTNGVATLAGTAINGVANLAQAVSTANNNAESTRAYVERNLVPRFEAAVSTSTGVTAEMARLERENQNTRNYVERTLATVTPSTGVTAEMARLERENQQIRTYVERTLVPRIEATVTQSTGVAAEIAEVKQQIPALSTEIKQTQNRIAEVDKKIVEQAKVNEQALPKLDQIVGILGLIPARAAAAIRPDIPTISQIEIAAATGTCRTTQPGGCMSKALNDNATNIANNNNTNAANILDAVNTGLNGALLTGQQTILARLGDQLPGGIGGKLSRFADWMHLDRVLNILIAGATIHNGLMLSNDIGQTFIGILNNVLQLVGLKKEDGSAFDIGSVISGSIENLIKGAIGTENYTSLTTAWAKANRIYQASTNILNSFQSLTSTVLSGLELVAGQTGKIGNALRASGEVLESAYQWMNPQPKINRVTNFLERLQNGASTIQQVTQVPLDTINAITELQTANTEFIKAIKEDDKPENKGAAIEEPAKLAESKELAKQLSKGLELIGIDLEADD
jgi:predicted  nucleic acid-binding Zn-ribbon protein